MEITMRNKVSKIMTHGLVVLSFLLLLFINFKIGNTNETKALDVQVQKALASCPFSEKTCYTIEWPDDTIWVELGDSIIIIGDPL